jgi:glycosyltransferase involved in cell wall biosynthesis
LFCPFLAPFYGDGRTPFVSIVVDLQSHYLPEFFPAAERARLDREFQRVARNAAGIVCISNYVRETVTRAPVLEAMAAGAPVLCSNVTSLPEIAGDAALMFDPRSRAAMADAIVQISGDAALRHRLIQAGSGRLDAFGSARGMAERYWDTLCQAALK